MKGKVQPSENRKAQEKLISAMRSHRKKYVATVNRRKFVIFPDVFSPSMVLDSAWYAKHLPNQKGKKVLEVGSGTGILAITAALQGAKSVTAVDINPYAVANTTANAKLHNVGHVLKSFKSDIYKNIPPKERFDTIVWNVPWGDFGQGERLNWIQQAFYDPGYKLLQRFITEASKWLKPKGTLLIGFSTSVGKKEILEKFLRKAGFSWKVAARNQHRFSVGHPAGPISVEYFEAHLKT